MAKKKLNHDKMVAKIVACDIAALMTDLDVGRFDYVTSMLMGEGYTQPGMMTETEVLAEWREGSYGTKEKDRYIKSTRAYQEYAYIRQLWDKGDMSGLHTDRGFFPVGSPEYKKSAFGEER